MPQLPGANELKGFHHILFQIVLKNKGTKQKYLFKCGSKLKDDDDSGDNIAKELPAEGGDIKEPMSSKIEIR